jgi:hypothetical protein
VNTEEKRHPGSRRGRAHSRPAASSGLRLRFIVGAVIITLLGMAGALAYGQIQRHIDPATGVITYIYHPSSVDRRIKGSTTPVSHKAPDHRPSRTAVSAKKTSIKPTPADSIIPSSYRDFPRVSPEMQKARDSKRRRILRHELAWEQAALDQAVENKVAGDVLRRHRENIESLHREIRNVQ